MENMVKVTVFCQAYNHEKYVQKCLEGFVIQKTTFPFEVIMHDDASTDGTADIIRQYAEKYPDIIKPIYQKENQYSKGVAIQRTFMMEKASGEYYAWCEGDDYWTDEYKLQKQVDFLDAHPDYSSCYHRVLCNNLRNNSENYIPAITESRDFEIDEIIRRGAVFHLSSLVMRADCYSKKPASFVAKGFGDVPLYLHGAIHGKCHVLADVMSVYNHGTEGSYTMRMAKASKKKRIEHEQEYIKLLEMANALSDYRHEAAIGYAIDRLQCNIYILSGDIKKARSEKYRQFYKSYKKQQRVVFVHKYFPFLAKLKKSLKRR